MIAPKRLRGVAALTTFLAIGAFGLPSSAMAGKSHHLKLYKVEDHIDIEGDLDYTLSCNPGDIATDGMWRIDDVSQDNEFDILGQWKETVAIKAAATSVGTYAFRFLPIAGGDVQAKLWVTCLENPAGPGGDHAHSFSTKLIKSTQAPVVAPGTASCTMGPAAGSGVVGDGSAGDCPKSQYVPIQPGFDMTGTDGYGYVMKNWHAQTGTDVGWEWIFNVTSADNTVASDNFSVKLSYRCLKLKSAASSGPSPAPHAHRIIQQYKTKSVNNHTQRTFDTHQVHCGEHYKGMVGMWHVNHHELYYLGMDPRIKSRAFKFVNIGFADHAVDLKLSCFKDRTS
jgi:hypothetical protein